jgi:hypothetical protein
VESYDQEQNHSTGELVKMMSEQVSVLIRDELKLAKLEMTSKGKQAALGAGMFGASGVVAIYGVGASRPTLTKSGTTSRTGRTHEHTRNPPGDRAGAAEVKAELTGRARRSQRRWPLAVAAGLVVVAAVAVWRRRQA